MSKKEIKSERIKRANSQKKETLERINIKNIQTKITENLETIPNNRRIILERRIEKGKREKT